MTSETTKMSVNETMKADLLSSAKWAKFLIILQCLGIVFLAGFALYILCKPEMFIAQFGAATTFIGYFYLALDVIMLYPTIKGFGFANNAKSACLTNNEEELSCAFANMRSFLRFYGILSIIYLCMIPICIVFGIIGAIFMASQM
ncbi:MAG: hypothetical protein K2O17_02705 [Bacteroidaceae bacterium]|nr:hypothetical protein [Bacteroidaceae bacterium]